jgi:drug/metabolite transporter (DMT)-like permease
MTTIGSVLWVFLALLSALFTSARHLYIKKWCATIPAEALVFVTRLFGALLLLPLVLRHPLVITAPGRFTVVLAVTVVLTAAATVVEVMVIQKNPISRSIPILTFIPLFMIPWTMLLLAERPSGLALAGICMTCAGAYVLHAVRGAGIWGPLRRMLHQRGSLAMFLVTLALGCTTTCDKLAIAASDVITYTFVWTAVSAVVMGGVILVRRPEGSFRAAVLNRHALAQSAFWVGAFISQMASVGRVMQMPSGVTYVKMLTMFNVLITVGVGGRLFQEGQVRQSLAAALVMVAGAVVVVFAV